MNKYVLAQVVFIAGIIVAYFSSPYFLPKRVPLPEKPFIADSAPDTEASAPTKPDTELPFTELSTNATSTPTVASSTPIITADSANVEYIEIQGSCGAYFNGTCVNVRSGPGTNYNVVTRLRNGVILQVAKSVKVKGKTWYKITFKEWLRYPERVNTSWYVSADYARPFFDKGTQQLTAGQIASTTKKIIVDRTKQLIYAYDGDTLFMKQKVSTGILATPTPRGIFTIFKKTPSRYMQGPIPGISTMYYDLPGVPWNLYFTNEGAVFHGAYWHEEFGHPHSNGCVNLPMNKAEELYAWADLGTKVIVRD